MKVIISQPMNNLSEIEISKARDEAVNILKSDNHEIINTYFNSYLVNQDHITHKPIYYLSKFIEKMSECDAVAFINGWQNCKDCKIEHEIAKKYGLKIIHL